MTAVNFRSFYSFIFTAYIQKCPLLFPKIDEKSASFLLDECLLDTEFEESSNVMMSSVTLFKRATEELANLKVRWPGIGKKNLSQIQFGDKFNASHP